MEKQTTQQIRNKFSDFWDEQGFAKRTSNSIVPPPNWQESLFIMSGFIRHWETVATTGFMAQPEYVCQPCIKLGFNYLDLNDMMAKDGFFTFFEQLSCAQANTGQKDIFKFVKNVWRFLTQELNLPTNKLHISVHQDQSLIYQAWLAAGVAKEQITFPDQFAFHLNLDSSNIHGFYSTISFDRGQEQSGYCGNSGCNINCDCDRFLELGDIGLIAIGDVVIIDHGLGLERIASACLDQKNTNSLPEIQQLTSAIHKLIPLDENELFVITDHLRSTTVIINSGIIPGNKQAGYSLRQLIRKILWLLLKFNKLERETVSILWQTATEILKKQLGYIDINSDKIVPVILAEYDQHLQMVERGKKTLRKFFKKRTSQQPLTDQEKKFLFETYGIPPELIPWTQE
ncbi:hypothetical protein HN858_00790 [Candidatus Falkowbacteria bacterium]|jgi:alanyl-tRNA synthetase|nr:hypothetical protein [Candidatus Falkowbacteria bacterium]MBT5503115.1 hypothetical protein [Candidatus Falkowbacteria bacterium]MBT6573909.1 hypothetical protein [Candidatus Falkowbacteria bacterium]MBT7348190.1 hypothetical protein [Candidatus Falkowbacteria bacterium]MBT7501252.1 hypothetical protein [Candidatus Falkowbacteria bacterium]